MPSGITPRLVKASTTPCTCAINELRGRLADPMSRIYEAHQDLERKTLRIVAHDESPHGAAAALMGLDKGGASRARKGLLSRGDLVRTNGGLVVTDPMLADWIRGALPLP